MIRLPSTRCPPSPLTIEQEREYTFLIRPYHEIPSASVRTQLFPHHSCLVPSQKLRQSSPTASQQPSCGGSDTDIWKLSTSEQMSVYDEEYLETILESLRRNLEHGINLVTLRHDESKSRTIPLKRRGTRAPVSWHHFPSIDSDVDLIQYQSSESSSQGAGSCGRRDMAYNPR